MKCLSILIMLLCLMNGILHAKLSDQDIYTQYRESYRYERITNYVDAFRVLIPVYNAYPDTYTVNLRLGWLSYLMQKYSDAGEYYKKAEILLPASIEVKIKLVQLYLSREEWIKAESKCNVILSADYYNYWANHYLIHSYFKQKKFTEAETISRKMLYVFPTDVVFLTDLGLALSYQEKNEEAKAVFQSVIVLDPENYTAGSFLKR